MKMKTPYRPRFSDGHVRPQSTDRVPRVVIYSLDYFWRQGLQAIMDKLLPADVAPVVVSSLAAVERSCHQEPPPDLVVYAYPSGVATLRGALSIIRRVASVLPDETRQVVITDELQPVFSAVAERQPGLTVIDAHVEHNQLRSMLQALLTSPRKRVCPSALPQADIDLTLRQRVVLRLLRQGMSQQRVAQRLQIDPKTVSAHKVGLLRRLHIHGNREIALLFSLADEFLWLTSGNVLSTVHVEPRC